MSAPPVPPSLVLAAGLLSLAVDVALDVVAEARHRAAVGLRAVATAVRYEIYRPRMSRDALLTSLALGLERAGGIVAGCGCVSDDPETCGAAQGGEWCECPRCHPAPPAPDRHRDDNVMVHDWMGEGRYQAPASGGGR